MKCSALGLLLLAWAGALAAEAPPPQPVAFRIGSILFDRPEGWSYSRSSDGIRAATLEKSSAAGPLRITFTRFPAGTGGSVPANLSRWQAQFASQDFPADVQTPAGTAIPLTLVRLGGTIKGGTPGGPAKDTADTLLLGAILEAPEGLVVVKLSGPKNSVAREEKVFSGLVRSAAGRTP